MKVPFNARVHKVNNFTIKEAYVFLPDYASNAIPLFLKLLNMKDTGLVQHFTDTVSTVSIRGFLKPFNAKH